MRSNRGNEPASAASDWVSTGFGMEEDLRRSHDVGFHHHLIKPVDLNKLDALIQQADPCPEELAAQT